MLERPITAAFIGFLLAVIGGIATLGWTWWWQERASCNIRWEETIGKANAWWETRLKEESEGLLEADIKGLKWLEEARELRKDNETLLGKQREAISLSDACTHCRVPWEWIWVREGSTTGSIGKAASDAKGRGRVTKTGRKSRVSKGGSK